MILFSLDRMVWADKSGKNNSPVEADISRMPIWKPDFINAKPAVEFSGTDGHYLSLQNSISDPTYLFAVAKQNQTGQSQIFGGNLFTTNEYGFTLNYDSQSDLISSSIPGNSWSVCVFETRFESQNLWINGELMGSASINIHPSPLDKIGHLFSGHIAECIVFTEEINFVNRQKIESYLGHKWGLTDRFPELHPYTLEPAAFGGDQEIIWLGIEDGGEGQPASLPVRAKSDQDFTLSALASSGLPVIFSSSDPTKLAIADNQAKVINEGTVTITAYQPGNTRFFPADPQSVQLQIIDFDDPLFQKDDQNITIEGVSEKVKEDPPFVIRANAESSGQNHSIYKLPVVLSVESGPATIDSQGIITLDGKVGTIVIKAEQSGNAFVNPATVTRLEIDISGRTRPSILFNDFKKTGPLSPIPLNSEPRLLSGIYSNNGKRIKLTSSNPEIVEVVGMDRIIARKTGVVELIFDVPPDIDSAAALTRTRSIEVVKPNRQFWLDQRREDPRFMVVRNQFIQRQMRLDSSKSLSEIEIEFDQMHADSDGDGFSNLYERAFGMDSSDLIQGQVAPNRSEVHRRTETFLH